MTTKERAAQMRREFKAAGWNARKISVRTEYFSLGSAIHVTVRDASVDVAKAKEIAEGFEHIRRDEYTGEILGGGNCYLHFGLSDKVEEELATPVMPAVERALEEVKGLDETSTALVPVDGTGACVGRDFSGWGVTLRGDTMTTRRRFPLDEHGARAIALELALAGGKGGK
jgi:hypothetical protein